MDDVLIDGTIIRVIDSGGHSEGRPWRAIVQNSTTDNTVHIALPYSPGLQTGDSIHFYGKLKSDFISFNVEGIRVDIPPQVILDNNDAYGRMELIRNSDSLVLSSSDGNPITSTLGNNDKVSVIRRSGTCSNPVINWVINRFSDKKVIQSCGPVIILDPFLCSGQDIKGQKLPFVNKESVEYIHKSTKSGRAGANTSYDLNDPYQKRWGVIIPRSLVYDPLMEWRGFVGVNNNLFPSRLISPESAFKITLAHEMAHVIQDKYGISYKNRASGECFADATALMMFIIDGGDPGEARLYAHQRSAGVFQIPGAYSTGLACHSAINEALRMKASGFPLSYTTHEILQASYKIAINNLPPSEELMVKSLKTIPSQDVRNNLNKKDFYHWMENLSYDVKKIFEIGRSGLIECSLEYNETEEAIYVLENGWNSIADYIESSGFSSLQNILQNTILESSEKIMSFGGTQQALHILKAISTYKIPVSSIGENTKLSHGTVIRGNFDDITKMWSMNVKQRIQMMYSYIEESSINDDPKNISLLGDIAMSLLLDKDIRDNLDDSVIEHAQWAWVASLPENNHMLTESNEFSYGF